MSRLTDDLLVEWARAQLQSWEADQTQYCTICLSMQPAHQEERDEYCVYVCDTCHQIIEVPF